MAILLERREEKSRLKGGGIMIKIEINFKLKKISIIRVIGQNVLVVSPNKQDNQPTYEAHSIQWHLPIVVWILPAYLLETFSCIYQRCSCL